MLMFWLSARVHGNRISCNASDITRVEETGDRKCRLTFSAESGGGAIDVGGETYATIMELIELGKTRESAIYAAAYKAKKTLTQIATTIELSVHEEIEKTVVKKLETDLGVAVEAHLAAIAASDGEAFSDPEDGGGDDVDKKN